MRKIVSMTAIVMMGLASGAAFAPRPAAAQDRLEPVPHARAHAPARIRVQPLAPYRGPNAVRQCEFWLATEYRPSGTVIVPRQHCWWARG